MRLPAPEERAAILEAPNPSRVAIRLETGSLGPDRCAMMDWDSEVALAALHESGYLEHCRRYAPAKDG